MATSAWTVEEQWAHDADGEPFRWAFWIADDDGAQIAVSILEREHARLIAAAPDVLAALKAMVASYDGLRDALTCQAVIAKLAAADAAIAKAEGH